MALLSTRFTDVVLRSAFMDKMARHLAVGACLCEALCCVCLLLNCHVGVVLGVAYQGLLQYVVHLPVVRSVQDHLVDVSHLRRQLFDNV